MITLLIGLASYRLYRLVSVDSITEAPREWVLARVPPRIDELIRCGWCSGTWWAFGVTWATDAVVGVQSPVLVGLAAAVIVGLLADNV